jgi:hypothetical protein
MKNVRAISFNTRFLIRINGTWGVLLYGNREYFVNHIMLGTPTPFARKNKVIFRIYVLYVSFSLKIPFCIKKVITSLYYLWYRKQPFSLAYALFSKIPYRIGVFLQPMGYDFLNVAVVLVGC